MNLTLGKKLGMGFAVILAFMVFSSVMAYLKSGDIKESHDLMFEVRIRELPSGCSATSGPQKSPRHRKRPRLTSRLLSWCSMHRLGWRQAASLFFPG
jgi:hypothetical protein